MTPLSSIIALKALDGLALRADVIAQNIANAGTADYQPMSVSFEGALADAAKKGPAAVRSLTPSMVKTEGADAGQPLRMDLELADQATTAGRYASLIEVLDRQLQIEALVVSGGH